MRGTVSDHLFCFRRYADADCAYVNASVRNLPGWAARFGFDLIVFHTTFLSKRWNRRLFGRLVDRFRPLAGNCAVKIALPQDEFINTDLLCEFVREMGIDHVFSVAPETEWEAIYNGIDRTRTQLYRVLTGYLDDRTVARIERLRREPTVRPIDVGYRAYGVRHSLGAHGYLKIRFGDVVEDRAGSFGLRTDISTRYQDTLHGDAWYRFLLRCRYALGVEGGASIHDRDGAIWSRVQEYVAVHPEASFGEVERACFPGADGSFALLAISPRHLEACATKTCQILVEGSYNGILKPNLHYIPVREDLGDLDEILAGLGEESRRVELVERAHADVVASGAYTYRAFVARVLQTALPDGVRTRSSAPGRRMRTSEWLWARAADRVSWAKPGFRGILAKVFYGLVRRSPRSLGRWLLAWRRSRIRR
jgi:hypothetical protein